MESLIVYKKAHLNYEITEHISAGMELLGTEVKSLRQKNGSLDGARVSIRGGEAFLVGAYIPAFQEKNAPKGYDAYRTRRLLLTKEQIAELAGVEKKKGLTIIPISVYNSRVIKCDIGIARGKKKFDKREDIKKRDTDRDVKRELKDF